MCEPVRSAVPGLRDIHCCRCDPTSRPGQPKLLRVQALASVGRPHRHAGSDDMVPVQDRNNLLTLESASGAKGGRGKAAIGSVGPSLWRVHHAGRVTRHLTW